MKCYVVTEGEQDREILQWLQGDQPHFESIKIVSGGGRSSAVSLARTLLVTRDATVALVTDADTTVEQRIEERFYELQASLNHAARKDRFLIVLAKPSVEAWLFRDEAGIKKQFGDQLTPEILVEARYAPRTALEKLYAATGREYSTDALRQLLPELDVDVIRSLPEISQLVDFISNTVVTASV